MPPAAEGGRNKEQWHEAESVLSVRTAADAYFMRAFEKRDPCNLPVITLNAFIRSAQWATTGLLFKGGPGIINSVFFRYIITRFARFDSSDHQKHISHSAHFGPASNSQSCFDLSRAATPRPAAV